MIRIGKTQNSPEMILDFESCSAIISGESWPENAPMTYKPLVSFLQELALKEEKKIIVIFQLSYFNTATTKIFIAIIEMLNQLWASGIYIKINWEVQNNDEDLAIEAEDLLADALFSCEIKR